VDRRAGRHPEVKLLLDEMLSPVIAQELRSHGHDVLAVAGDRDREGMSDPEVMALARTEHRAIVTNNLRDYRPLHHEAITPGGPGHDGMVFMPGSDRRTKDDTGRIIAALQTMLAQYPGEEDLANGESWL
jgi:predicted nuclease of predicted toxin-antitoxin system